MTRKIIHIDMDCFYAAVETKYHPELRGKALGIGGPPNSRSVLCTANYEARKFGVRAAMPSSRAVKLCPQLVLVPPNFELYKRESRAVREIFRRYTDKIEPLSLDEAYLDVSGERSATFVAKEIRAAIFKELELTASAGVAPNKFLAKIASDWKKPNGQFVIRPDQVGEFVKTLKVEKIFGVGKVTAEKMHGYGLFLCSDIQKQTPRQMQIWFGSRGLELREMSFGRDDRPVNTSTERKSFTVEETFNKDLTTLEQCLAELHSIYEHWERRVRKYGEENKIRGYVVKVKYFDFRTTTHETSSRNFPLRADFENLLKNIWLKRAEPIRLIGLGVRLGTNAERETSQLSLLD